MLCTLLGCNVGVHYKDVMYYRLHSGRIHYTRAMYIAAVYIVIGCSLFITSEEYFPDPRRAKVLTLEINLALSR